MERWEGKVAVVTGASAGIGAAICVRLANEGLRVVGLARRPGLIDDLTSQINGKGTIQSRKCDVSKPDEIAEVFKWIESELGGVAIMVNNAGVFIPGHITDVADGQLSDDQLHCVVDTNVRAVMLCTRKAVSSMKRAGGEGHVVNINSIAGHYIPFADQFNVYSSSKYAVTAFSAALLNELAQNKSGIRVTSISPGLVDTAMAGPAQVHGLPMLRPADVADAVAYAISTPPSVNINEITITPLNEKRL